MSDAKRKFVYEVEPLQDGSGKWGVFQYDLDDPAYGVVVVERDTKEEADQELTVLLEKGSTGNNAG
jgi:hypothetical protein